LVYFVYQFVGLLCFSKRRERAGLQYKNFKHNSNEYRSINNNGIDAGIVTSFAVYFFYKVTIPPRQEPDSFSENDEEEDKMLKINNYLYMNNLKSFYVH
jgi:hypothetical protein